MHLIFRTRLIKFRIASSPKLPCLLFFRRFSSIFLVHQLQHIGFYFGCHCNWVRLSMDLITFKRYHTLSLGVVYTMYVSMALLLLSNAFQARNHSGQHTNSPTFSIFLYRGVTLFIQVFFSNFNYDVAHWIWRHGVSAFLVSSIYIYICNKRDENMWKSRYDWNARFERLLNRLCV